MNPSSPQATPTTQRELILSYYKYLYNRANSPFLLELLTAPDQTLPLNQRFKLWNLACNIKFSYGAGEQTLCTVYISWDFIRTRSGQVFPIPDVVMEPDEKDEAQPVELLTEYWTSLSGAREHLQESQLYRFLMKLREWKRQHHLNRVLRSGYPQVSAALTQSPELGCYLNQGVGPVLYTFLTVPLPLPKVSSASTSPAPLSQEQIEQNNGELTQVQAQIKFTFHYTNPQHLNRVTLDVLLAPSAQDLVPYLHLPSQLDIKSQPIHKFLSSIVPRHIQSGYRTYYLAHRHWVKETLAQFESRFPNQIIERGHRNIWIKWLISAAHLNLDSSMVRDTPPPYPQVLVQIVLPSTYPNRPDSSNSSSSDGGIVLEFYNQLTRPGESDSVGGGVDRPNDPPSQVLVVPVPKLNQEEEGETKFLDSVVDLTTQLMLAELARPLLKSFD